MSNFAGDNADPFCPLSVRGRPVVTADQEAESASIIIAVLKYQYKWASR